MLDNFPYQGLFSALLLRWYRKNSRDLPWRKTRDPYRIWVSEVMLQQTTVTAVLTYYTRWLKIFPDIKTLARADIRAVLKAWQGLGYYARARNIHQTSRILVKEFGGELPADPRILKNLPGFGPYTVGAVMSIAFQKPAAIVDANVRRVFQRILAETKADADFDKNLYLSLEKIVSRRYPGDFNQALMELGALVCRSKEPCCNLCPVKDFCLAHKKSLQELIPIPKRSLIKKIRAVVAIIRQNKRILIQKRPDKGLLAGLWEFPGGKVEPQDKDLKTALKRELSEELACDCRIKAYLGKVSHSYTQFRVELNVFEAEVSDGFILKRNMRWATLGEIKSKFPMPSGSAKIIDNYFGAE